MGFRSAVVALGMEAGVESKVLDHGYVKLIDKLGSDESVIDAARMSVGGGFVSWEPYAGHPKGDAGLLEYLYRHGHTSPFEMCELVIEVYAPIFVMRQWMRHRTFSFNEASARYAPMDDAYYLPKAERMRRQSGTNKQGSGDSLSAGSVSYLVEQFRSEQVRHQLDYALALDYGLSREIARLNAPVSQYTKVRVKGNLRNWLAFLNQRLKAGAQEEIRVYAEAVARRVAELWPRTWALFEEWDRYGRRCSRTELRKMTAAVETRDALRAALRAVLEARESGLDEQLALEQARLVLGAEV